MKQLLVVHSSPRKSESFSRKKAEEILGKILKEHPNVNLIRIDLSEELPNHWGLKEVLASFMDPKDRKPEHLKILENSDRWCQQVLDSDIIIVSTPMWNFSIPSTLKAWIDHIVRAGVTFKYTEQGPLGLLRPDQKLILVRSSGGIYQDPNELKRDHTLCYLKDVFTFLGIREIEEYRIENTVGTPMEF